MVLSSLETQIIVAPPKNIRIERRKFFARRGAESRRALAVCKVFSDEGLREIYKLYVRVFRWSDYNHLFTYVACVSCDTI